MRAERKLFGTDGVRGAVGSFLNAELATTLGRAATASLEARRPQVLIIRDTRESGPMLEAALAAGIASAGGDAFLAGVLPTPAAAILVRRLGFDLAAVVSASHNPFADNGIKFFDGRGQKLADEVESRIESLLDGCPEAEEPGRVSELNGGLEDYLRELEAAFRLDLGARRVLLDCANGATFRAAPAIFERLGAEVEAIGVEPDGRNINAGCGSTHVEALAERIAASEAEIGFAFDGDELIALAARGLAARGELEGGVVVTVMSNFGFHSAMEEAGVEVAVTQVGDRYVIDEMRRRGWRLGGEQSGHIIASDFAATGDGIAAALMTMRELGSAPLEDAIPMRKLPQVLENVRVLDREAVAGADAVWAAVDREEAGLRGRGRVLVRPSGTEPLVRVMVEAPTGEEAEAVCGRLVGIVRDELA